MPLKMFTSQSETHRANAITHIVAVAAGKGGVGKSSVTVNLALALKGAGYAVGIMDADVYGPSIRRMLPEEQPPSQSGEMIFPAICRGIRMISMAYFRKENEAMAVRAPVANGVIMQFIKNVNWGMLDFLLIDFPPGTGDIQLTLSQQASLSGAIVVTTPQEVALMDVRKAANLFEQVNVPIIGVVENMSHYQHEATGEVLHLFGKGGGERLAREIGTPFLGAIPIDPSICHCGDEGLSLFDYGRKKPTPAIFAFDTLAKNVVDHVTSLQRLSQECLSSFNLIWKEMP